MNQSQQRQSNNEKTENSYEKISQGFERLVYDIENKNPVLTQNGFDVVIIGSGYGGAIAAAELSACQQDGQRLSICVLERGKEYLPGSFPADFSEVAGHVRFNTPDHTEARGNQDGLFDFRIGSDVSALVGNGLGGGSLINAGVMEIPIEERFNQSWPSVLQNRSALWPYYQEAKILLGAAEKTGDNITNNTINNHKKPPPQKYDALRELGKYAFFRPSAITIAMHDKTSCSGLKLKACNFCGDCATGCNFGAKESLDTNLLDLAHQQGAILITGATVLWLEREELPQTEKNSNTGKKRWKIFVTYTDKTLRKRQGKPLVITAERVVLSAGTFGSTEILKRSETETLKFSNKLGEHFSGNGDMAASAYNQKQTVNNISKREIHPTERHVGPTNTGIIETGVDPQGHPFIIEELAVPNSLRRFYEELTTTAHMFVKLSQCDNSKHRNGMVQKDPCAVDPHAMDNTAVLAIFGDDGAKGKLQLKGERKNIDGNGCLNVQWPEVMNNPLFDQQIKTLNQLCGHSSIKGTLIPNPMWKFLPDGMDFLEESNMRGPYMTVHPLGGCVMADSIADGVVDHCGRVFKSGSDNETFHEGLVILDGSIIPSALGTNPALTIAAVSLRAIKQLINIWKLDQSAPINPVLARERPTYRDVMEDYNENNSSSTPAPTIPTKVQLVERLGGKVMIKGKPYYLDITMRFCPSNITQLMRSGKKCLEIDGQQQQLEDDSRIRILEYDKWEELTNGEVSDNKLESILDEEAQFLAPLNGHLTLFERESSSVCGRLLQAIYAWLFNRGLRDTYQAIENRTQPISLKIIFQRIKNTFALASRAGEVRILNYNLHVGTDLKQHAEFAHIAQQIKYREKISGFKRFTYSRRANPWRQLMELRLEKFPWDDNTILKLDTKFLARKGVPLFKIVQQQDQPTALLDCASFLTYIFRLLINIHLWSFRLPDPINAETPQRLPGSIPGLPEPKSYEFGVPGARLTRYPNPDKPPLIIIHGYSIGGTSFTHQAIGTNITQYFYDEYDIWILDLRTSSGSLVADQPWSFEDIAFNDIPAAFDYVFNKINKDKTKKQKINVIAHCMGAAMLSMAILKEPFKAEAHYKKLDKLPDMINCLALSQVGPRVSLSPDNMLRTYVFNYFLHFFSDKGHKFRNENEPTLVDNLLDRLFSTLPYPEEEFDLENPPWPPCRKTSFTRTRHRADALYGRNFSLKNIQNDVLDHIDDLYGSFNIETIAQVIHFARWKTITSKNGNNDFVSRKNFIERWRFNTFSLHGKDNDLSDISTVKLMQQSLEDAGRSYDYFIYPDYGHLDCLIGRNAKKGFEKIQQFFEKNRSITDAQRIIVQEPNTTAVKPSVGPHIGKWIQDPNSKQRNILPVAVGSSPGMTEPYFIVIVPVDRNGDYFTEIKNDNSFLNPEKNEKNNLLHDYSNRIFPYTGMRELQKLAISDIFLKYGAEGLVVLFIHDDSDLLNDPTFNRSPFTINDLSIELTGFFSPDITPESFKLERDKQNVFEKLLVELRRRLEDKELLDKFNTAIKNKLKQPARELESCFIQLRPEIDTYSRSQESLCFALASCQYPAGILDQEPAFNSYQRINSLLNQESKKPSVLLLIGDQVYIDATAGLFNPTIHGNRYRRSYQMLYQNQYVREVMRKLPSFNMLDDHEINNNWEPIPGDGQNKKNMERGRVAFRNWQQKYKLLNKINDKYLWFDFEEKGFPFFMIDSRTERDSRNSKNIKEAKLISKDQFDALKQWLSSNKDNDKPKFIVSPAMPFPRTRTTSQAQHFSAAIQSDSWDGYPDSLERLVSYIVNKKIQNVVFLSGDAHLSLVSKIKVSQTNPSNKQQIDTNLLSIHSSGMYAPFPFANSRKEDLTLNEKYSMPNTNKEDLALNGTCSMPNTNDQSLCVTVETDAENIDPGNGFSVIEVVKERENWRIDIIFDRTNMENKKPISVTLPRHHNNHLIANTN